LSYVVTIEEVGYRTAIRGVAALALQLRKAGVLDEDATNEVARSMLHEIQAIGADVEGTRDLRDWTAHELNYHG
jgi:hypothetical protein